jgi:hypothetical protein
MKKYIFFTILAVAAVFSSCKDFLVEEPNLAQSTELTLSTFEGLDKATAGAYAPMASTNWYGAHFILDSEMQCGNGKRWTEFSKYNSGRYTDQYAVHYTPNSTSPLWGQAYFVILSANSVLEHLNDAGIEATDAEKNNLKAECLFLRALAHFDLVRVYAQGYGYTADASHLGVPYVTKVDSEAKPARETVATVYKNIIDDLLEAEKAMSPDYQRGGSGMKDAKGYANIYAIQALLARVYLYSKDYQNAALYAGKVIDAKDESGKPVYSLWQAADFKDAKNYTADAPTGGEIIFEIYNNTSSSYGTGLENCWGMTSYKQYGDCGVSKDLYDLYEDGDARKQLITPDPDGNALFTLKYAGKGLGSVDANNVIVLRLAEMYLIRAEANVTLNPNQAVEDLKTLATSRGATPATASVDYILIERRKELAWEGHYWYDLARLGKPMTRTDISGNVPTSIDAGNYRWALPIPDREFTVNPNLKQNDGYNEN